MENIENFKKVQITKNGRVLSDQEAFEKYGFSPIWHSLEQCAYNCAYNLSNDWAIEQATWKDVIRAYKIGAIDGINYQKENTYKNGNNPKKK